VQKGVKGFRDFEGQPGHYFLAKVELVFQLATPLLDACRFMRSFCHPKQTTMQFLVSTPG
jgi:hypothetical protein